MSDNKIVVDSSDVSKATQSLKDLSSELGVTDSALVKAEGSITQMANALKAANAAPLAAGFVLLGAAVGGIALAAKSMMDSFVDAASKLNDLQKQTGLTVEELSVMQQVAQTSGTSMDTVAGAVIKFEKSLAAAGKATSLQAKAFKELGIDTSDASKSTQQYIDMAASKLDGLADGWQKNNVVMALFGKTGTEVNEFLSDYANRGEVVANITTMQAEQAESYQRSMRKLEATMTAYSQVVGGALLPVAQALMEEFVKLTAQTSGLDKESKKLIGNNIGEWAIAVAKGFGHMIDFVGTAWNMLKGIGLAIGAVMGSLTVMGEEIALIMKGDFSGAWNLAKQNVGQFGEAMSEAYNTFAKDGVGAYALVERAEQNYLANRDKVTPATKSDKRVAGNIGVKDEKESKAPSEYDMRGEYKKQTDDIIKLRDEYKRLYGVQEQTSLQMVQAAIDAGAYNDVIKDGVVVKKGATAAELEQLKAGARTQDFLKQTIDNVKEEVKQRREQAEVASRMEAVKADKIAADVLKVYGATNTDAAIAVNNYNIQLNETRLSQEGLTKAERDALEQKQKLLLADKDALAQRKINNEEARAEQRQFSYGWENAFKKYEDDATNAAKNSEAVFGTASKGMEDALVQFAMTGKLSFSSMAQSILADIARIAARKAVMSMFSFMMGSEDGNAFGSSGVLKSADGNVFDKPTLHGYSGGIGMLGEAGPEAVMPLQRTSNGKLGVIAQGGGSQVNNISVNVTVQGGQTNDQTGNSVASKVAEQFTRGIVRQELMNAKRTGGMLNPI